MSACDYSLVLAISNADALEELEAARKFLGMGADAFILSGSDHHPELLNMFKRRNIPFVFTSIWDPACEYPTIGYDNSALAKDAVEYLASDGHRNIAIAHGPLERNDRTRARKTGALLADCLAVSTCFFETEISVAGGKSVAKAILNSANQYSAILCFSDVIALGVYFHLQDVGIKIPDEISIMGFDNLDWSQHIVPALTTIHLPAKDMGKCVANVLVDHLEAGRPIVSTQLFGHIISRASVMKH